MNPHGRRGTTVLFQSQGKWASAGAELMEILGCMIGIRISYEAAPSNAAGKVCICNCHLPTLASPDCQSDRLDLPGVVAFTAEVNFREVDIEFHDNDAVPFPFRGARLATRIAYSGPALTPTPDETVLASANEKAIWVVRSVDGTRHFRSALPLVDIGHDGSFAEVFCGERFVNNLPLVHFLKQTVGPCQYQPSGLKAAFMFDDPNLHWRSYGLVNYSDVAAHAAKENYHVSFATIPLDAWYTSAAASDVFRSNARLLSLLVHGNNHSKQELTADYSGASRSSLLAQANQRIERLERIAGLEVSRVMVPPHGACSEAMLAALPAAGFEAACISSGSLKAHNSGRPWTRTLGFLPGEMIVNCPVLPRWGLNHDISRAHGTVLIAAYLGRPMIFRGHHRDLKGGVEILDEYARFINRLGDVQWKNLRELSRMSYQVSIDGDACRIMPLSNHVVFNSPPTCKTLSIESADPGLGGVHYVLRQGASTWTLKPGEYLDWTRHEAGDPLEITCAPIAARTPPANRPLPRTSASVIFRRLLTEGRDRLYVF